MALAIAEAGADVVLTGRDGESLERTAADIARLLGDICDGESDWQTAVAAYETARPLSLAERRLVDVFDQANLAMSGLTWLDWLFIEQRPFADWRAVAARIQEILGRINRDPRGGTVS